MRPFIPSPVFSHLQHKTFYFLLSFPSLSSTFNHCFTTTLLFPFYSIFPFVVSISKSSPVPGDGLLTLGIGSQRRHGGHADAALEALWLASRAVPSPIPVARRPKGNSHQRQWAAYQGKQQSSSMPACTQRHRQRKGKNKCK